VAADKSKSAKGNVRGRMPTKTTINLMVVDENKIKPLQAIPAILAILVLAAVFSKFLVIDRLAAVSAANGRVSRLQRQLDETMDALESIGDVHKTYAHYTYDGMTSQELSLVDRTQVVDLVVSALPPVPPGPTEEDLEGIANKLFREAPVTGNDSLDEARRQARLELLSQVVAVPEYTINSWEVANNLLTLDVTGKTLERMNELAREIEKSPIVDSCSISTAKKDPKSKSVTGVQTRFIVYLQQPAEAEDAQKADTKASSGVKTPNFSAVTQFVGGEVSQDEGSQP